MLGEEIKNFAGRQSPNWSVRYERTLGITDAAVVLWATIGALVVRFGVPEGEGLDPLTRPYVGLSFALAAAWWSMLYLFGSREPRVLGYGTDEYKRVLSASLWLFGLIAIISYALRIDTARGYVGVALPAGLAALLISRVIVRKFLHIERQFGRGTQDVLIVGDASTAEHLTRSLQSQPMAGYRPIGVYLPGDSTPDEDLESLDLPIIGRKLNAQEMIDDIGRLQPHSVALSGGARLTPPTIRALGWALAEMNIKLIMVPALTDIAGPRIHTQPVAGLPLIHVSTPNLEKGQRFLKRSFDVLGATSLLLLLAPVFLAVAVAVKLTSSGPAIFRQHRVGAAGVPFTMYKFRSMVVDAEKLLPQLREGNEGNSVLFKMKVDPRVTRVGAFIRRYSIDELPQLFNVVLGSMSLVGPRPPLPSEVEKYDSHAHRRLLVRPGLTGLWQVSGRSLLSWDDTVRLDLYYVENWSFLSDLAILLRTVRAVIGRHGAY
ncbi:exopolysaccharide biosynthesis polyprenyl glycosylphosphotransferase [Arthrobacter sp. JZ12]|uniref:sugar transferase n=1 Tax=Arthrobacter sp. JZ12 TaxID=2654190 RepID=UPI002B462B5A|nr:sugar transferase [Arthrobacter sp. JZ12]WRH24436.1 exopolysaccharide biosynthesis polyprenyl glycosylphosphotransferase [Arthrobacter sp. JZ12]